MGDKPSAPPRSEFSLFSALSSKKGEQSTLRNDFSLTNTLRSITTTRTTPVPTRTPNFIVTNSGTKSLQDHLLTMKKATLPHPTTNSHSLMDVLRQQKQSRSPVPVVSHFSSQPSGKTADQTQPFKLPTVSAIHVDASKPVGTGVVALARMNALKGETSLQQPEPEHVVSGQPTSDLAKALISAKNAKCSKETEEVTPTDRTEGAPLDDPLLLAIIPLYNGIKPLPLSFIPSIDKERIIRMRKTKWNKNQFASLQSRCISIILPEIQNKNIILSSKVLTRNRVPIPMNSLCIELLLKELCHLRHQGKCNLVGTFDAICYLLQLHGNQTLHLENGIFSESELRLLCHNIFEPSTTITHINFGNCYELKNTHLSSLESKTCIKHLNLKNCSYITDEGLLPLWNNKKFHAEHIQSFSLKGCFRVSGKSILSFSLALQSFSSCMLEMLDISYCQYIDDESLLSLLPFCGKLEDIRANYTSSLSPVSLLQIPHFCKQLKSLSLNGISTLDDITFSAIVKGCGLLTRLSVSHCYQLTSIALGAIELDFLVYLDISHCDKISNQGVLSLGARKSESYENVNFTNLAIDAHAVNCFLSYCGKSLFSLSLGSTAVDGSTLSYIQEFCPNLTELDLSFCHEIPLSELLSFLNQNSSISKLSLWGRSLNKEDSQKLETVCCFINVQRFCSPQC